MIGFGAIVKTIARAIAAAAEAAQSRLLSAAYGIAGRRPAPVLVPVPVRKPGRGR